MPHKDPEDARRYQREYTRRRRAVLAEETRSQARPVRLRTIEAVQTELECALADVEAAGGMSFMRARIACRVLEIALRAVEQGDLERRLAEVERRLGELGKGGL